MEASYRVTRTAGIWIAKVRYRLAPKIENSFCDIGTLFDFMFVQK